MTISSIADKLACAGAFLANTGKLGCLSLFGEPAHLIAMQKGSVILAADNFDIAFLKPLAVIFDALYSSKSLSISLKHSPFVLIQ